MSTQYYTPNQQFASQQPTSQQPGGPSWFRIWAVIVGSAVAVVFIALAVTVWHGHSSSAPASHGTSPSTVVPAHPTAPVVPPAQPTAP
jgi:hypothetical protein